MALYAVGQNIKLRGGKLSTITRILEDSSLAHQTRYQVRLEDSQLLGVDGLSVMHLVGPQRVRVSPSQVVVIMPREATEMPPHWTTKLQGAFTGAWAALHKARQTIGQIMGQLAVADPPDILQDIIFCTFRITYASTRSGKEDYRRLLKYVDETLEVVLKGLLEDELVVAEIAGKYEVPVDGFAIGGYVNVGPLDRLAMWWSGDDQRIYSSVKATTPLESPIHLNFSTLISKEWDLTQTLIHEATHKFARTVDHVYLKHHTLSSMTGPRATAAIMGKSPFEAMEQAIAPLLADKKGNRVNLTPVQAMNNADSYAMFVMWVRDRL